MLNKARLVNTAPSVQQDADPSHLNKHQLLGDCAYVHASIFPCDFACVGVCMCL